MSSKRRAVSPLIWILISLIAILFGGCSTNPVRSIGGIHFHNAEDSKKGNAAVTQIREDDL